MHKVAIPQSVVERVIAHRGKEHVYEDIVPGKTALVVVDMQNAFLMQGVAHVLVKDGTDIVPNINRLAAAVRETGGKVVWIKNAFDPESLAIWSVFHNMTGPDRTKKRLEAMGTGTKGHELWPGLDVKPEDMIVGKDRYSAFLPGSSRLPEILRGHGIDTVIVTGTVTNVCCESTARDAMMSNFKTVMVTDANAAHTDEEHNASLIAFYLSFGDIASTDQLVAWLKRNTNRRVAAE
jgi:ureidoacrylate peracid hydrolase